MPENEDKPKDHIQLRSERVQEILAAPPGWMINWANMVILGFVVSLLVLCRFIKYPDIIRTKILVTTVNPPRNIFADNTIIPQAILVTNKGSVHKGQPLLVLAHAGYYQDILLLKGMVDTLNLNNMSLYITLYKSPVLNLGDMTPLYALFKRDALAYIKNRFKRKALENVIESQDKLKLSLRTWEAEDIIRSPMEGKILFSKQLNGRQNINKGNLLFTIISNDNPSFIGNAKISATNFFKMHRGQHVAISLSEYPESLYGNIEGIVDQISASSDDNGQYEIIVKLQKGLTTSLGKNIEFKQEMTGTANIITEDLSLLERVFKKFRNNNNLTSSR